MSGALPDSVAAAVVGGSAQPEVLEEDGPGVVWHVAGDGVAKLVVLAVWVDRGRDLQAQVLHPPQIQEQVAVKAELVASDPHHQVTRF